MAFTHLERTLRDVDLYIGDGAVLARPLVRRRGRVLIGHARCRDAARLVQGWRSARRDFHSLRLRHRPIHGRRVEEIVQTLGRVRGVEASLAYDGLTIRLGHSHLP
jgi:hypothetical protein